MPHPQQNPETSFKLTPPAATTVAAFFLTIVLCFAATQSAQAQNYQVLYSFTGGMDGAIPYAGLTRDPQGNLYGTTVSGGSGSCNRGCGTVFELSPSASGWTFNTLYQFQGGSDAATPLARVIFGPNGSLYGTTYFGGFAQTISNQCAYQGRCGTVFKLTPPPPNCQQNCSWTETVLHRFSQAGDGANPMSELVFDQSGNMYGTTYYGGSRRLGAVYELSPSNGGWTESVIHSFIGLDGQYPESGVTLDQSGNLYGTTQSNLALNYGMVYKLLHTDDGWSEQLLFNFSLNYYDYGSQPLGGVVFDHEGNLYGATYQGGYDNGGTAYELSPSNGLWNISRLAILGGSAGAYDNLTADTAGNFYGTTNGDGAYNNGNVFKLWRQTPQGAWHYTDLYDFNAAGGGAYGPYGSVTPDADGNLYGTAASGGSGGYGVVWEITP